MGQTTVFYSEVKQECQLAYSSTLELAHNCMTSWSKITQI